MLEVQAFRSKQAAQRFIKFQGWTTRQAQPRMMRMPGHKLANKYGRVSVVKVGESKAGALYVFESGKILEEGYRGLPE